LTPWPRKCEWSCTANPYTLSTRKNDMSNNNHNEQIEIEQLVLGGLILHNELMDVTADIIQSHHFGESFHSRIYASIGALIRLGRPALPRTIKQYLKGDPALTQVDSRYLESITSQWMPGTDIAYLCRMIRESAVRRGLVEAGKTLSDAAANPHPEQTPEQIVEEVEERLHAIMSTEQTLIAIEPIERAADRAILAIEQAFQAPATAGVSTGFDPWDRVVGKMGKGDLIVLGGATSMGKTSMAQQVAWAVAKAGRRAMVFTLEMTAEEYTKRHLAQMTGISTVDQEAGTITSTQMTKLIVAAQAFRDMPIWIDGSPTMTVSQIRSRARRLRRRGGVDFILIDHLRFIAPEDPRSQERDQLQQITRDLKALAKELQVPVLLVAHLNRDANKRENHKPTLSDLYGSASIEQNADTVAFVHREEYWLNKERPDSSSYEEYDAWSSRVRPHIGRGELIVAKRRRGPTGEERVGWNAALTLFYDLAVSDGSVQDTLNFEEQEGGR
jgi:replicative DNA helicase